MLVLIQNLSNKFAPSLGQLQPQQLKLAINFFTLLLQLNLPLLLGIQFFDQTLMQLLLLHQMAVLTRFSYTTFFQIFLKSFVGFSLYMRCRLPCTRTHGGLCLPQTLMHGAHRRVQFLLILG